MYVGAMSERDRPITIDPSVGASLLAKAVEHSTQRLFVSASSRAGSLPQGLGGDQM